MKTLGFLIFTYLILFFISLAQAAQGAETCVVKTGDVGRIEGRGTTSSDAQYDASMQCFQRRSDRYLQKYGTEPVGDVGEDIMLTCVNITCS